MPLTATGLSERRLLAVLALLLSLVAGLLLILESLRIPRELTLEWFIDLGLKLILGIVLIMAGLIAYGGKYMEGGVVALVIGVIILILWRGIATGILAIAGGLLALVAERA